MYYNLALNIFLFVLLNKFMRRKTYRWRARAHKKLDRTLHPMWWLCDKSHARDLL